jgi:hypothetical protein
VRRTSLTLAHQAATVLQYRRASVGLLRGARLEISAVSGQTFIDEKTPEMKALKEVLTWASGLDEGMLVVQEEDGSIDTDRPETLAMFRAFFEASGSRTALVLPLRDDEGRIGVFLLEGSGAYAFGERDIESAGLLAVQASGALRNALLYEQIPMARIIRPVARTREKLLGLAWGPRAAVAAGILALGIVLFAVPVPLRVGGAARILPSLRLPVAAEVEGRVRHVFVREGDRVAAGEVLADMDDSEYRAGLEDARSRFEVASREESRLRAQGQSAEAAAQQARVGALGAEVDLWSARLASTRIRARAEGIVATPRIEETTGSRLAKGDVFCEVVDPERQRLEISVPERDAGVIEPGMRVKVKLDAHPTRSLLAEVERVGVIAAVEEGERVFLVQARLDPVTVPLRSGMAGRAKITTGPASIARVVLRRPGRWLWSAVWGWLP